MFLIFKIFPEWLWWLLLIAALSSYLFSYLPPLKPYALILKNAGLALVVVIIFIFGMLYADKTWQQAAQALEAKVAVAEAESKLASENVQQKIITQTKIIKQRGENIVKYIDREVVKYDTTCVIPQEFVNVHNQAATK